MIELPLFPGYRPDLDWNKARVDEARDFIKMVLTTIVKPDERFIVGYSGGKDSTMLLQLMLEALDELGDSFRNRLIVSMCFTRYELDFQRKHMDIQADKIKALGIDIRKTFTNWEESYAVVTLGVGVISKPLNVKECNRMKSGATKKVMKFAKWNFSGTRGEESNKRKNEERIGEYDGIKTARALKYLKEQDVWGYLNHIGSTKWGLTYDELHSHYLRGGDSRDGCWVCPFHKGGYDEYSPAQKRVIEKLNLIRGVTSKSSSFSRSEDYPGRTVPWPTGECKDFNALFYSQTFSRSIMRPINVCMAAYDIVNRIEREENEVGKIIFKEEHPIIRALHSLRNRYGILRARRWMLNKETWGGRKLIDLDPWVEELYSKYKVPSFVANRCNGDWFGRWARETERLSIWRKWESDNGFQCIKYFHDDYHDIVEKMEDIFRNSGYVEDENKEPFPGFYRDGDPAAVQENCKLEVVARTWMNE